MKKVKYGGITYGRSHKQGGIPVKNQSTGDMLEVEGGEGIVNKRSMASDKKVKLNGKEMTICEAVSQLNQLEGGVQFSCDDVSDRQFIEAMNLGGELERGTRTEAEHIQVLKDLYAKRITPKQAAKRIAKDHLKEDKRYYTKLAKMEGKMANGGLVAPNGKKSNLTAEQYKLVRTKAFKNWFGDWENDPENASKVVDENGEPLVVYHGTKNEFNTFKKSKRGTNTDLGFFGMGFYFSKNINTAKVYGNRIRETFLNLRNPLYNSSFKDRLEMALHLEIDVDILKEGGTGISASLPYTGIFSDAIKEKGYDGHITKFGEYVAFEPEQIKLADGTNTTFDGNNPDIRFEDGGKVPYNIYRELNFDVDKLPKFGYHGTQSSTLINPRPSKEGRYGEGFYLTLDPDTAEYFGRFTKTSLGYSKENESANVFEYDLRGLNLKYYQRAEQMPYIDFEGLNEKNYDGIYLYDEGEIVIFNIDKLPNGKLIHSKNGVDFESNNPDIRFEDGGKVKSLIDSGVVELEIYDAPSEHAQQYGIDAQNPLYVKRIFIKDIERQKGLGDEVLMYLDQYAREHKHDAIFGHITQQAEPSIAIIKQMLTKNGYSTSPRNNDFWKEMDASSEKKNEKIMINEKMVKGGEVYRKEKINLQLDGYTDTTYFNSSYGTFRNGFNEVKVVVNMVLNEYGYAKMKGQYVVIDIEREQIEGRSNDKKIFNSKEEAVNYIKTNYSDENDHFAQGGQMFDNETEKTLDEIHKKFSNGGEVTPIDSEVKLNMKEFEGYADEYNSRKNKFFKATEEYQSVVTEGLEVKNNTRLSKEEKDRLLNDLREMAKSSKQNLVEERNDFVEMRKVKSPFYAPQLADGGRISKAIQKSIDSSSLTGTYEINAIRNESFPNIPMKGIKVKLTLNENTSQLSFTIGKRNVWGNPKANVDEILEALNYTSSTNYIEYSGKSFIFLIDFDGRYSSSAYAEIIYKLIEGLCNKKSYENYIGKKGEDTPPPTSSESQKPKMKSIEIVWNEGAEDLSGKYPTWSAFQDALKQIGTPSDGEGYNKTRIQIDWDDNSYLTDRVDLGMAQGDFNPNEQYIGTYLKNQGSAAYVYSFPQYNRNNVDWGEEESSKGDDAITDAQRENYVTQWLKSNEVLVETLDSIDRQHVQNVVKRIAEYNKENGSVEDFQQIYLNAKNYQNLQRYIVDNDIVNQSSPDYDDGIADSYVDTLTEIMVKIEQSVNKFEKDYIDSTDIFIARLLLAQLDTFDIKYIKNLNYNQ